MACPHTENCPLYAQFSQDSLLKYWKTSYCHADYNRCARYQLSKKGEPVPLQLLPSGRMMSPTAAVAVAAAKPGGECA
jgi:hypothetical protein